MPREQLLQPNRPQQWQESMTIPQSRSHRRLLLRPDRPQLPQKKALGLR